MESDNKSKVDFFKNGREIGMFEDRRKEASGERIIDYVVQRRNNCRGNSCQQFRGNGIKREGVEIRGR